MKKNAIKISLFATFVMVIASLLFINVISTVEFWNDKIYPSSYVQNIDLGGKTKEEAVKVMKEQCDESLSQSTIKIRIRDGVKSVKLAQLEPEYDLENIISEAYEYGKSEKILDKYSKINKPMKNKYDLKYKFDNDKIDDFISSLAKEVNRKPTNAKITRVNEKFVFFKEVDGYKLDAERFKDDLMEALNNIKDKEVFIDAKIDIIKPTVSKEQLQLVDTKVTSFTSKYLTNNEGRVTNIKIATKLLNGQVVMPGEEFSFNKIIGETTVEKGYKPAAVIIANEFKEEVGGGICQVSTTLYNSIIKLNIRSVERRNHSLPVSYVPVGTDAAVAYGLIDYKFKNTLKYPLYLEGITNEGVLTINTYSNSKAIPGDTSYRLTSEVIETIEPGVETVEDSTLVQGEQKQLQNGITGYKTVTYIEKIVNGKVVSKEIISKDTYNATITKVAIGIQKLH